MSGPDQPAAPPVLYTIVCGAGPASSAHRLVECAQRQGWDVWVIATRVVVDYFLAPGILERVSGHPVRTDFRSPGAPGGLPRAAAAVVAPATYNTINKWAAGIADTFALSTLAELTGASVPVGVLPFVNEAFAANRVFHRSVEALRGEGVRVLLGPGQFVPYAAGAGEEAAARFPWNLVVDAVRPDLPSIHRVEAGTHGGKRRPQRWPE
ncbi:MAG: flavoprotein [Dactylosporangium sp.]|nr:flavoprotein [Dactylosporangium sp.]NNJ60038.1 flavoprotein [Dactylosporangium sp.]